MDLRKTLKLVHCLFGENQIDHVLIGGLALACHGSTRGTSDLDLLVHEENRDAAKKLLLENGFVLDFESKEVLQFSGMGHVDILLARRPISREMLKCAHEGGPLDVKFARSEDLIGLKIQAYKNDAKREFQDKADIQYLIQREKLDWDLIKKYADLFDEWGFIDGLRKKCQS